MPTQFDQMYGRSIKKVLKKRTRRGGVLLAKDPLTKKKLDVGTTSYADDIAETKLTTSAEHLRTEILESNGEMDTMLGKLGMAQNTGKAVHILNAVGPGSPDFIRETAAWCKQHEMGKVCSQEKYLGNIRTYNGGSKVNLRRRMQCAQECYYSMAQFWTNTHVRTYQKARVYRGLVENALLSGL